MSITYSSRYLTNPAFNRPADDYIQPEEDFKRAGKSGNKTLESSGKRYGKRADQNLRKF